MNNKANATESNKLESIPLHWEFKKLIDVATLQRGKDLPINKRLPGKYPVIGSNGVVGYHSKFVAEGPGVLIGRSGSAGKVTLVEKDFWPLNTTLWVKNFHGNDPNFVYYLLSCFDFSKYSSGVSVPTLNRNLVHPVKVIVPPLLEQRAIARALRAVQAAREARLREIALERERKAALMEHLFTHGTRGEPTKMTEIGEMPESWKSFSCEQLCENITVGVVVRPSSYYVPYGVPAFRSFNIREDKIEPNNLVYFSQDDNETILSKSKIKKGDVLIVRTGYTGTAAVVPEEFDGANCIDLVIARSNPSMIKSEYLSRYLNSSGGKHQALASEVGLAQKHLNVGAVNRMQIPLPNIDEQCEISDLLKACDSKIAALEHEALLLDELFRAMLEELMTGRQRAGALVSDKS